MKCRKAFLMRSCCQWRSILGQLPHASWHQPMNKTPAQMISAAEEASHHNTFTFQLRWEAEEENASLYSPYKFSAVQVTPLSTRTSTCTNWQARGQGVKSHTCCILYESSKKLRVHLSEKLSSCWVRSETGTQKSWLPEPVIFHGARNFRVIANRNLFCI